MRERSIEKGLETISTAEKIGSDRRMFGRLAAQRRAKEHLMQDIPASILSR